MHRRNARPVDRAGIPSAAEHHAHPRPARQPSLMIANGLSNTEIAHELYVSDTEVKTHITVAGDFEEMDDLVWHHKDEVEYGVFEGNPEPPEGLLAPLGRRLEVIRVFGTPRRIRHGHHGVWRSVPLGLRQCRASVLERRRDGLRGTANTMIRLWPGKMYQSGRWRTQLDRTRNA